MSKVIVELMGGSISCSSVLNQGSTFKFVIPVEYHPSRHIRLQDSWSVQKRRMTNGSTILDHSDSHVLVIVALNNQQDVLILRNVFKKFQNVQVREVKNISLFDFTAPSGMKLQTILFLENLNQVS